MKKQIVKLEIESWCWGCPTCKHYNFIDNEDLWDGNEMNDLYCDSCEKSYQGKTDLK